MSLPPDNTIRIAAILAVRSAWCVVRDKKAAGVWDNEADTCWWYCDPTGGGCPCRLKKTPRPARLTEGT